jgi:hypothetical protein
MRMVIRSIPAAALAFCLGATHLAAQQPGSSNFQWYVGGHGGVMSIRTPLQDRTYLPTAGGSILITAKRTGLLLSVDQAFGSDETTATAYEIRDTSGGVIANGAVGWTFQGVRKYSAILVAYPIQNRNVAPFVGLGVGLMHTTGNSAGRFADGRDASHLSSSGFGTAIAGLEFRAGPFSAFGEYQITTKLGFKSLTTVLQQDESGKPVLVEDDFGEWLTGATHTLIGGLRLSLGSAREQATTGGY